MKRPLFHGLFLLFLLINAAAFSAESGKLTVLTFNICALPGSYPLQFGGVAQASVRAPDIAELLLRADSDVIVLQEAQDNSAVDYLVKKLRQRYPYAYYNIREDGKIVNSGLFVASKYPLEDFEYREFRSSAIQKQISKGFVNFKVLASNGEAMAHLFATHLQPHKDAEAVEIREQQMREIVQAIRQKSSSGESYPFILSGDLNIPWGCEEYWSSSLFTFFDDPYTSNLNEVTIDNLTATDYMTDYCQNRVNNNLLDLVLQGNPSEEFGSNPYREIIDYIVIFRAETKRHRIHSKRLTAFSFSFPLQALSDHQPLMTTINFL